MQPRLEAPGVIVEGPEEIRYVCQSLAEFGQPIDAGSHNSLVLDYSSAVLVEKSLGDMVVSRRQTFSDCVRLIVDSFCGQYDSGVVELEAAIDGALKRVELQLSAARAETEAKRILPLRFALQTALVESLIIQEDSDLLFRAITTPNEH